MKQDDKTYMTKTFGRSATTRQEFEDMPYPICTINITDEQMEKLVKEVEDEVISKYPDVAEKMFVLWREEVNTDEEIDFLMNECSNVEDFWWSILQFNAINNYGAKYYCDIELGEMKQYAKPTKEDMENAIESERNKQSQEKQIESAIEDIDIKSAEYKEAAEMMAETKRRAEVVELAEKLWLRNLKDLAEYSYYDAFKDAETFIKLKSKYLKEGKLC